MTHITIVCVTLYLHRGQTHRGITFHPAVAHFMRFWLWLTTGMVTKQWVAIHRKHHQNSDKEGDPHSPWITGWRVFLLKYPIDEKMKWRMKHFITDPYHQFLHKYYNLLFLHR